MPTRTAEAVWTGTLKDGKGGLRLGSGQCDAAYSFASRFESGEGTNPEELLGAAHAGCFSMALSLMLSEAGHAPEEVRTSANVSIEPEGDGFAIKRVALQCQAKVPGISEEEFRTQAENARKGCPVSKALAGVEITLDAQLV
jgi:osmotically inducible protein OsmC